MEQEELTTMLSAQEQPVATAQWLRAIYLPELIKEFNTDEVRKRLGLYQGERIPDNERNLTDVRNRVSLIIEYELARLSNDILLKASVNELFWCYVVANRFPDLEVRKRDGSRCLRIEVKCLQSIAEEKSANFDTLKKDINPDTDFVVVFLWEWAYLDSTVYNWERSPQLLRCYLFHAASLASLRDTYWLNKPPIDLGGGHQGFDLRYAVNCKNNVYAEEEGNYGKLLRIWQSDFPYRPANSEVLLDTESEYLRFKKGVIFEGFQSLCKLHLPNLSQQQSVSFITRNGLVVGAEAGIFGFFFKSLINNKDIKAIAQEDNLRYIVTLTEKYVCTGYELINGNLDKRFNNLKPKLLSIEQFNLP